MARGVSGIYQIQSIINDKIYIGSAVNLKIRKKNHLWHLKNNKHGNNKLQNHVNKYGLDDLKLKTIEFCDKENLLTREQYYIDLLKPQFNLCPTAGSQLGNHWKLSKISIEHIKAGALRGELNKSKTPEVRLKISIKNKGKVRKDEVKAEIAQTLKTYYKNNPNPFQGRKHTEESKQKIRLARLGKSTWIK